MIFKPKHLFLLDALGASSTAFLLFFVVGRLEHVFGIPKTSVHFLSLVAVAYAIYSFGCFIFIKHNWRLFLYVIASFNSLYCFTTIILMHHYYAQITRLGLAYFIFEIVIIGILVFFEFKTAGTRSASAANGA